MTEAAHWVSTWVASAQGAYPVGSTVAQPDLSTALPDPTQGMVNQSLRMILRPALWASRCRLRLSNVFGDRTVTLRGLRVGLHVGGGAVEAGSSVSLPDVQIEAGKAVWTTGVDLPWINEKTTRTFQGRSLAFSAWVQGASGPVTWHAKAMATSYLSAPNDPNAAAKDSELGFAHTITSNLFVDALDMWLPDFCHAVVAFGDSLTDGTATTLNGSDRWTDVLQRELIASGRSQIALINAGIGGNQVAGPRESPLHWRGGPPAISRLECDVLSLSGVREIVWLQGINDFSENGNLEALAVAAAMSTAVARLQSQGLKVIGATIPSALGSTRPGHGSVLQDARRQRFNQQVRAHAVFEEFVDVDAALTDSTTGRLRAEFNGDSTLGEPGDGIHPNRAGHAAIALAVRRVFDAKL